MACFQSLQIANMTANNFRNGHTTLKTMHHHTLDLKLVVNSVMLFLHEIIIPMPNMHVQEPAYFRSLSQKCTKVVSTPPLRIQHSVSQPHTVYALINLNSKLILQLRQLGHSVSKVEYIIMGGTFMSLDDDYKDFFIRNLHDALSGHTSSSVHEAVR